MLQCFWISCFNRQLQFSGSGFFVVVRVPTKRVSDNDLLWRWPFFVTLCLSQSPANHISLCLANEDFSQIFKIFRSKSKGLGYFRLSILKSNFLQMAKWITPLLILRTLSENFEKPVWIFLITIKIFNLCHELKANLFMGLFSFSKVYKSLIFWTVARIKFLIKIQSWWNAKKSLTLSVTNSVWKFEIESGFFCSNFVQIEG
jgi:hypothetical protein